MKKVVFTFFLLLAAVTVAFAQEGREKHLDIIFVIDASGSMHFTDPEEFRKVAVKAFIDITQDRGGDRIAVLQFAGWNETTEKGATVFPLTEIPSDEGKREKLLTQIKESVTSRVSAFGKGTDFNFAFEKAVAGVLEERRKTETPNKVWVILLTDGTTDVKEGGNTRKEYLDAAGEAGRESRKALNDAAQKYFTEKVLPQIAKQEDLFLTCISLTEDEPSPELKLLGEKAGAKVLRTTREALRGVFIEALASLPKDVYRSDLTRGFGYNKREAAPGAEVAAKFRIYQGASVTRALIFASGSQFTLDLKNPEGKSISNPQKIKLTGAGELYRVISISGQPPGEYTLWATNISEESVVFETLFFAQFDLEQVIDIRNPDSVLQPGEELVFEISLLSDGKPITDKNLLKDLAVGYSVRFSPEAIDAGVYIFTTDKDKESRNTVKIATPNDMAPGEYEIIVQFRALKQTLSDKYAFSPPPVKASFSVPVPEPEPPTPEPEPEPPIEPEPEPEPEPPIPEPEPEPQKKIETIPSSTGSTTPEGVVEDSSQKQTSGFPLWLIGVVAGVLAAVIVLALIFMRRRPKGPVLEFKDQQLWSAGGDARLLGDMGEGSEVAGTPEIPDSIIFRLAGTPEAPKCQAEAGPKGEIYVDKKPVTGWTDLHHGAKIEVEAAGRPEAPIYKYTYFERDPAAHERDTATGTVPKAKRETSIKPEDIFPTDVLEKEKAERKLPPPPDDDELIIYDDK